jgi:hypothetical protein
VSRRTEAKKARRTKRRAAKDASWIPDAVLDEVTENVEQAEVLEHFDELVTQRGWMFSDEFSDDNSALWFYPPSTVETIGDEVAPVTTIVMFADDDAEIAHVMFVGTDDGYPFAVDGLLDHLDKIEAYRLGDARPDFDTS